MKVRVRKLTARCTEEIQDLYVEEKDVPEGLEIGRSFIEGDHLDLIDIARDIRTKDVCLDYNGENDAFYERLVEQAEAARCRWADAIEAAVRAALESAPGYPDSDWGPEDQERAAEIAILRVQGMSHTELEEFAVEKIVEEYRTDPSKLENDLDYLKNA